MIAVMVITQMMAVVAVLHAASEAHHCHHGLFACPPDCEHHRERSRSDAGEMEPAFTQCRSNSVTTLIPQMSNAVLAERTTKQVADAPDFVAEPCSRTSAGHPTGIFRPPGLI